VVAFVDPQPVLHFVRLLIEDDGRLEDALAADARHRDELIGADQLDPRCRGLEGADDNGGPAVQRLAMRAENGEGIIEGATRQAVDRLVLWSPHGAAHDWEL